MKCVFLHGMGQNAKSWDSVVSNFGNDIDVVCPEMSDFFTVGECYYDKIYGAFCEYCKDFSEPINLCGLSLGAVLALNYAIDFPNKVNSVILIAPQYDMPKFLLKVQNVLFKFMPESQFKDIGFTKNDFITLTNSMAEMNFTSKLGKVKCPSLLICGEKDGANKKATKKLSEKLVASRFCEVKNAGHEVNVDNPEFLAKLIADFWSEIKK